MTRYKERFVQEIARRVPLAKLNVLEIGCGEGARSVLLAKRVQSLMAIDPDRSSIAEAKKSNAAENITYRLGRAEKMSFAKGSFDAAIFTLSLHHVQPQRMHLAIREALRVVKKGGWIIFLELGNRGSLYEAEQLFCRAGEDERQMKALAYAAIMARWPWREVAELWDTTTYSFDSADDYTEWMAPQRNRKLLKLFLQKHHRRLSAERRINIFQKK